MKRYEQADLSFSGDKKCSKGCGSLCLKNSEKDCPVLSVGLFFVESFQETEETGFYNLSIENQKIYGYEFSDSQIFTVSYGNEEFSDNYVNSFRVSLNGNLCLDPSRQPSWNEEEILFQNQDFGCGTLDSHPLAEVITWSSLDEFFSENYILDDLEDYSEGSTDIILEQKAFFNSLRRASLKSNNACWGVDLDGIKNIDTLMDYPFWIFFFHFGNELLYILILFISYYLCSKGLEEIQEWGFRGFLFVLELCFIVCLIFSIPKRFTIKNEFIEDMAQLEILHEKNCFKEEIFKTIMEGLHSSIAKQTRKMRAACAFSIIFLFILTIIFLFHLGIIIISIYSGLGLPELRLSRRARVQQDSEENRALS